MHLNEEIEKLLADIEKHSHGKEESACDSSYAALSSRSAGRVRVEAKQKGEHRTAFARDRDRILYSKAFFRLAGKTQVFMSPRNPLISNRMTHTIHVAQISRAVARVLHLNEDLAEAIALGHDTGHPPFGHRGEKVLDELSRKHLGKGFEHNTHSLRMLDILEKRGRGLNLSYEVREGIIRHCGESKAGNIRPGEAHPHEDLDLHSNEEPSTLEGCVVKLCDRIGYVGKDIEDATASGIIMEKDIPEKITGVLGKTNNEIIDTLVKDLIMNFYRDLEVFKSKFDRDPVKDEIEVRFSEPVIKALNALILDFNYPRIYESEVSNIYAGQTENMIRSLFNSFLREINGMKLPETSQASLSEFAGEQVDTESSFNRCSLGDLESQTKGNGVKEISQARVFIIQENLKYFKGSKNSIMFFLAEMDEDYWQNTTNAQMVVDYLTLMTDDIAMAIYESLTIPKPVV
jgi:dGTPase